jgi:hypothetical protein
MQGTCLPFFDEILKQEALLVQSDEVSDNKAVSRSPHSALVKSAYTTLVPGAGYAPSSPTSLIEQTSSNLLNHIVGNQTFPYFLGCTAVIEES